MDPRLRGDDTEKKVKRKHYHLVLKWVRMAELSSSIASLRRELHIKPSDELILSVEDNQWCIMSVSQAISKAQANVKKYAKSKSGVARLKVMRQEDAQQWPKEILEFKGIKNFPAFEKDR